MTLQKIPSSFCSSTTTTIAIASALAGRFGALKPSDNCQPTFNALPPHPQQQHLLQQQGQQQQVPAPQQQGKLNHTQPANQILPRSTQNNSIIMGVAAIIREKLKPGLFSLKISRSEIQFTVATQICKRNNSSED
uniref:Uncharacterized protein n=1 Tax=Glossina palpalis gambiensis TaxID=67801 RepID=A0A1B0BAI4_9MUSC